MSWVIIEIESYWNASTVLIPSLISLYLTCVLMIWGSITPLPLSNATLSRLSSLYVKYVLFPFSSFIPQRFSSSDVFNILSKQTYNEIVVVGCTIATLPEKAVFDHLGRFCHVWLLKFAFNWCMQSLQKCRTTSEKQFSTIFSTVNRCIFQAWWEAYNGSGIVVYLMNALCLGVAD